MGSAFATRIDWLVMIFGKPPTWVRLATTSFFAQGLPGKRLKAEA
jgi:hypothetical protein